MLHVIYNYLNSPKKWKDSVSIAFGIIASSETIMSIAAISPLDLIKKWWIRLFIILLSFFAVTIILFIIISHIYQKSITLNIRGIPVTIMEGDLLKYSDWKLISFTERFDTQVDDVIINANSLNGKFILKCIEEQKFEKLQVKISDTTDETHTSYKRYKLKSNDQWLYPLGRIKIFEDYMLLAFTHINENYEAHLTRADYEQCLRVMWREISRTYANKPIALPILGAGITRFDDWDEKSSFDLLKCMLCTLNTTRVHINKPITIMITQEEIKKLNLYELKGAFSNI